MAVREAFFLSFALESIMRDENIQTTRERFLQRFFSLSLSLSSLKRKGCATTIDDAFFSLSLSFSAHLTERVVVFVCKIESKTLWRCDR